MGSKTSKTIDIKPEEPKNSNKKEKTIEYLKDLGMSTINTNYLFKFAIRHWITPLIAFIIVTACLIVPPYLRNNNKTGDQIINQSGILYSDMALSYALSTDVKCKISNAGILECDEGYKYIEAHKEFENDYGKKIYYDIYINAKDDITLLDEQEHFKVESYSDPGDNYIALYEESFIIRYVYRNSDTGNYSIFKVYGFYTELSGLNLHDKFIEASTLEESEAKAKFDNLADEIIAKGYNAAYAEVQFIQLTSNLFSYLLLIGIASLLIKGNYLLNRKKGFKYTQCIKITIMSSCMALPVAFILSLFRFDLVTMFGLIITFRTLYIWLRYTSSRKNTDWLKELYEYSKDERFNIIDTKEKE